MVYLTFRVQIFKCQVLAAAGCLVSSNAHCRTVFSLVDKMGVHLMEQNCPILSVKDAVGLSVSQTVQYSVIG